MNEGPYISERFFERFDESLTDGERLRMLRECEKWLLATARQIEGDIELPEMDLAVLREYARDASPAIRAFAVGFLCEHGYAAWSDLEAWARDSEQEVRESVTHAVERSFGETGEMCRSDRERCIKLIAEAIERHADYSGGIALHQLSQEDDRWLELTWSEAGRLLDTAKPEIVELLACCYYEHVVPERNWGPDDPHLKDWVRGSETMRKCVLLNVARWVGLGEGRMREIAEALAQGHGEIASMARDLLRASSQGG